jgi:glycosyltransferase involved in cell wall biosynthesis
MKILLILPNLQAGGAERALLRIAKGEAERGHDIHLVLLEHHIEYAVPDGISLHALRPQGERMSGNWFGKRVSASLLRRWHRNASAAGRFDLILASLPLSHEVARLAGLPDVWHQIANTPSAEIAALAPRKAARRVARYRRLYEGHRVTTVSDGVRDDLIGHLKIHPSDAVTIYNPFDFDEMRRAAKAPAPDLPQEPYVLHVGRFAKQKRHDVLLKAFAAADIPHRLVILTRDVDVAGVNALVQSMGMQARVTVSGFRENPFPWYANASALILSSDFEGMPNVMIEALGVGTPVVSTDCPSGPREVLTGSLARFLAPPGDAQALGERLREAVTDPPRIEPAVLDPFTYERSLTLFEGLGRRGS